MSTREPYIPTKEPYTSTKEPYTSTKEPYTSTKEPLYIRHRTLHIHKRAHPKGNGVIAAEGLEVAREILDGLHVEFTKVVDCLGECRAVGHV